MAGRWVWAGEGAEVVEDMDDIVALGAFFVIGMAMFIMGGDLWA